jgi:hypothetical protein
MRLQELTSALQSTQGDAQRRKKIADEMENSNRRMDDASLRLKGLSETLEKLRREPLRPSSAANSTPRNSD